MEFSVLYYCCKYANFQIFQLDLIKILEALKALFVSASKILIDLSQIDNGFYN